MQPAALNARTSHNCDAMLLLHGDFPQDGRTHHWNSVSMLLSHCNLLCGSCQLNVLYHDGSQGP